MTEMQIQFQNDVPVRHREALEKQYHRYCRENWIRLRCQDLQMILGAWVACGNDPYRSNRYGFYDSRSHRYLDFLDGEYKALQIIEIMAGKRESASCCFDQYGEPMPAAGVKRIPDSQEGLSIQRIIREAIPAAEHLLRDQISKRKEPHYERMHSC